MARSGSGDGAGKDFAEVIFWRDRVGAYHLCGEVTYEPGPAVYTGSVMDWWFRDAIEDADQVAYGYRLILIRRTIGRGDRSDSYLH